MSQARNLANFGVHTTTSTGAVTFLDGATDVDVAQHDGSNGLKLGGTLVSATATELNLIDGGTARGTTAVASGDGVIVNDAGTMRMTDVDTVDTYFAGTTKTLTNKTVTSPVINTSVSGSAILDEDAMGSNSATQLATQQSIKAYVDGVGSQTGADAQALGTGNSPTFAGATIPGHVINMAVSNLTADSGTTASSTNYQTLWTPTYTTTSSGTTVYAFATLYIQANASTTNANLRFSHKYSIAGSYITDINDKFAQSFFGTYSWATPAGANYYGITTQAMPPVSSSAIGAISYEMDYANAYTSSGVSITLLGDAGYETHMTFMEVKN